jgi:gas vesicle protein
VITIILDYEKAEEEYVSSNLSYAALASKHNIPLRLLARYAKDNNWVEKRKRYNASPDSCYIDVSKLARSSDALESIIENAFTDLSEQSSDKKEVDTKTLKDLTSTLKEAINIKQNIFLLPILTEQKQFEFEQRKNPVTISSENEIKVILEDDTDKYCM